jgi:hypothetical protein
VGAYPAVEFSSPSGIPGEPRIEAHGEYFSHAWASFRGTGAKLANAFPTLAVYTTPKKLVAVRVVRQHLKTPLLMSQPRGFSPNSEDSNDYYAGISTIRDELLDQTDRGAAIVGVALLDDKLRTVIRMAFPKPLSKRQEKGLFGPTAPLGTYDAKVRLGEALGLFPGDVVHELNLLGRVRNKFAHDLNIREFADPLIAPLCEQLKGYRTESIGRNGHRTRLVEFAGPSDARSAFILSVDVAVHLVFLFAQERLARATVHYDDYLDPPAV